MVGAEECKFGIPAPHKDVPYVVELAVAHRGNLLASALVLAMEIDHS